MTNASELELVGGRLCLDFANTIADYRVEPRAERIVDYAELLAWSRHAGALDDAALRQLAREAARRPREAEASRVRALALRDAIFATFHAIANDKRPPQPAIDALNVSLADALGKQQLVREGDAWVLRCVVGNDLEAPLCPIARSAAELLTDQAAHARLHVCGGGERDCTWLFVDESRNGMRRWCSMRDCGNRAKARRHYERTRHA